jgi:hypothetical protein
LNMTIARSRSSSRTITSVARRVVVRAQLACSFASASSIAMRASEPFTTDHHPISVIGVKPTERGSVVRVPGVNERADRISRGRGPLRADGRHPAERHHDCSNRSHGQPARLRNAAKHSESGISSRSRVFWPQPIFQTPCRFVTPRILRLRMGLSWRLLASGEHTAEPHDGGLRSDERQLFEMLALSAVCRRAAKIDTDCRGRCGIRQFISETPMNRTGGIRWRILHTGH